ncbi:MAG: PQQ-binding-like beta-propeller repeat protein [Oscillospiraceae bacterium]|nr:PQQ-binding-like beta-propeller repeat protein [Oscillospiraceae bacterium]
MSNKKKSSLKAPLQAVTLVCLSVILGIIVYRNYNPVIATGSEIPTGDILPSVFPKETKTPETRPTAAPEPTPEPTPEPVPEFNPSSADSTRPELLIASTGIMVHGEIVDSYELPEKIDFGFGSDYAAEIIGITAFRGNNFRDSASYGYADITKGKLTKNWTVKSASLVAPDGEVWSGHGWTGQPLIVKWPKETRAIMNMKDWAKEQDELTEVVYAGEDGIIYYLELETGKATRDKQYLGISFKGSGSLDPRGYPILYVGGGYHGPSGTCRAFIISLIDGSILYEFGHNENFALRAWPMFDGSPLVDADTDQLIYPGENGLLYIIKLNTDYDPGSGTLSIEPEVVKWRYQGTKHSGYWLGYEDSPVIWRSHMICSDNGGRLLCLDLNTFELAWVFDCLDDTNDTPVLELEDGHPYIYISTSNRVGLRAPDAAGRYLIPVWKLDAVTGEIVWQKDYDCYSASGLSGGVQGTLAVGKNDLSDLIFVPVARTPNINAGRLAALDKKTGEQVWYKETAMYSWSSPVCVYTKEGKGCIVYCTSGGYMYLLDGLTGETLDYMDLGGNIEASPAVFENTIVVGTRSSIIYGLTLE